MNANELAQEFEEYLKEIEELPWGNYQILCDQAATMLRQQQVRIDQLLETQDYLYKRHDEQQAEIEALKARIERMVEDRSKYEVFAYAGGFEAGKELKKLTDEEIFSEILELLIRYRNETPLGNQPHMIAHVADDVIARAILRKAQE